MCKKITILTIVAVLMTGFLSGMAVADTSYIYVDPNALGANDGSSWPNAYTNLQDALAAANSMAKPVEIWVARGVYKPDQGAGISPGDRNATFQLISDVALYGGFPSGGGQWEDRDPNMYETVLSGDLIGNDTNVDVLGNMLVEPTRSDNSIHVVTGSGTDATALIDGFTVTAGYAVGITDWQWGTDAQDLKYYDYSYGWDEFDLYGAGMFNNTGSPTVKACNFIDNAATYGAGIYNYSIGSPRIELCNFSRNVVSHWGGGIMNALESDPVINTCTFNGNQAGYTNLGGDGAAIETVLDCNPVIQNCVFMDNHTTIHPGGDAGAAICERWRNNTLIDECVFFGNLSSYGGAVFSWQGDIHIRNSTFRENTSRTAGGAIFCWLNNFTQTNCSFEGNKSEWGGAESITDSTFVCSVCTFINNLSTDTQYSSGGAVDCTDSDSRFTNCLFSDNKAKKGGVLWTGNHLGKTGICSLINCTIVDNDSFGIYIYNIIPTLKNCILWNNYPNQIYGFANVNYSNIEGGYIGTGNIDIDPLFVDPAEGDFHLKSQAGRWDETAQSWVKDNVTSPCIDAGDPASDWHSELWPHGGRSNMGAYGNTTEASMSGDETKGCIADLNYDGQVNIIDFSMLSNKWMLEQVLLKEDMDRNGLVSLPDAALLCKHWLWQESP
ncbi:MAG: hypothetical protein K9M57_09250 [Phycisphaerae bacterium]|nr:hypothetical protein [Phycisphaerae bacterium]